MCKICKNPTPDLTQHKLCNNCLTQHKLYLTDYPVAVSNALAEIAPRVGSALKERVDGGALGDIFNVAFADKLLENLRWFYQTVAEIAEGCDISGLCTVMLSAPQVVGSAGQNHAQAVTKICRWLLVESGWLISTVGFVGFVRDFPARLRQVQKLAAGPVARVVQQRGRVCPVCFEKKVFVSYQPTGGPVVSCITCGHKISVPANLLEEIEKK